MLVLTRKLEESLVINEKIIVTVLGVEGDRVKLGIEAPKHIKIHRKEIYDAIMNENAAAAELNKEAADSILDERTKTYYLER